MATKENLGVLSFIYVTLMRENSLCYVGTDLTLRLNFKLPNAVGIFETSNPLCPLFFFFFAIFSVHEFTIYQFGTSVVLNYGGEVRQLVRSES